MTGGQAFFTSGRYRKVSFLDADWLARQHYNQIPVRDFFKSRLKLMQMKHVTNCLVESILSRHFFFSYNSVFMSL